MSDKELLTLAAKAAGYTLAWGETYIVGDDEVDCTDMPYIKGADREEADSYWNPLEDDGDALRLVVKLRLDLTQMTTAGGQQVLRVLGPESVDRTYEITEDDPLPAMRRAIVRAAAEIGRTA
jgi:hypothetical protein